MAPDVALKSELDNRLRIFEQARVFLIREAMQQVDIHHANKYLTQLSFNNSQGSEWNLAKQSMCRLVPDHYHAETTATFEGESVKIERPDGITTIQMVGTEAAAVAQRINDEVASFADEIPRFNRWPTEPG